VFKHLLVPLDGSSLAEAALAPAAFLADKAGAKVTLLHVIERGAPPTVHGARHLTTVPDAEQYLGEVARSRLPAGLTIVRHVHTEETRDLPRELVRHAAELAPDLIVMCAHGHGGVRDFLFGGIAQRVVARGATPVLLVRSSAPGDPPALPFRKLLVPDDATEGHEPGMDVCATVAALCGAPIHLVMVVETLQTLSGPQAVTGALLPAATRALLDMAENAAKPHLLEHVRRLQGLGLAVTAEVRRGEPVAALAAVARETSADLLVLRTHGKAGTDAFWSGSLAPRLASQLKLPLLLVPVK
jgi:nucleotide-binding universal stress UspA family protein